MSFSQFQSTRKEYVKGRLDVGGVSSSPVEQFQAWLRDALQGQSGEPNAMCLATCDRDGRPSARMVLLKSLDEAGLVFATSYLSRKAAEIETMAFASVVFYWPDMERQVRVEGSIARTSAEESDEIFRSRPRGSQLAARVSLQSQPVADRTVLEQRYVSETAQFDGEDIPRPESWGGYRILPDRYEFWQGGENRLHDRIEYRLQDGSWLIRRLQP